LLFIFFLAGGIFLTMSMSLNYETIKPELVTAVSDLVQEKIDLESGLSIEFSIMQEYCQNNSEYVFKEPESGRVFVIPCEVVSQGLDSVVNYSIENFVDQIYYDEYDCDFWNCFETSEIPFFLVSQKAKDYWVSKFYLSLLISAVLIGLMFLFVEHKTNLPLVVGGLLIISSLPFAKFNSVLGFISDESFFQFFTVFLLKAHTVFLIFLITGIILVALGIVLKFFKIGFVVSNFFSRFGNNKTQKVIVKEKTSLEKSK